MKYCPLISHTCFGEECALAADDAGDCLIKQALQLYVSQEKTKTAEKESATKHFEMLHKNGMRTPVSIHRGV